MHTLSGAILLLCQNSTLTRKIWSFRTEYMTWYHSAPRKRIRVPSPMPPFTTSRSSQHRLSRLVIRALTTEFLRSFKNPSRRVT